MSAEAAEILRKPGSSGPPVADSFGRALRYLRVSVTDRCDLRCVYCMPERMSFLPKPEVLSFEELDRLCTVFVSLGVRKLRITGGEPLMRKGVMPFIVGLTRHLQSGALDELALTTNGTRLAEFAPALAACGVRRVNVSLDSLRPETYTRLTRGGDLARVLVGLDAAERAGLRIKINTVALAEDNRRELPELIAWAHGRGFDLTLIETMPLGDTGEDRTRQFLSLAEVKAELSAFWTLSPLPESTGGPSRYYQVAETGGRLGFITPLSEHFCDSCNRVRLTCSGRLHACLGHEDSIDLRALIRGGASDVALSEAIFSGLQAKPRRHEFRIGADAGAPLSRHMSMTGG